MDGDFSESGILAVGTSVNIDFPARVDEVLEKVLGDAYTNGIELNPFFQKLEDISAALVEAGFDADAVAYLENQLKQLPSNTKLTFKDQAEANPSAIGVYMIGAVIMDPDYESSADAGLLVITNDVTLAELKWNYRDDNNIITRAALAELDMAASAYVEDAYNEENTSRISYMVFGVGSDGSIVLTQDPADIKNLPNGTYTEIAYIYQEISAKMTLAIPIQRTFVIVEHNVDVIFDDVKAVYDGKQHAVDVTVKDLDSNVIDDPDNLTVTYINLGTGYYSTVAPTDVGSYTVVAKYEKYINGDRAFFGMEVGNVTITPAKADYKLTNKTVKCGTENAIDGMITNNDELPYAIYVVVNKAKGEVNVILPAGWEIKLEVGATVDDLVAALEKLPAVIENTEIVTSLKSALNSIDTQTLTINGKQPDTFGEYTVTAIAFGNKNYNVAKSTAVLTIEHVEETVAGKAATCTEPGLTEGTKCSVCGVAIQEQKEIPATDHAWGKTTYEWSEDGKTCTAKRVCGNDATHVETAKATITSAVKTDATCETKGTTTYTATFEADWATTQTKDVQDIPVKDHYDAPDDGDHICDYGCGETITECVDNTGDNKCDDCGADMNNGLYPIHFDPDQDTTGTITPGATVEIDGVPYTLDENCIVWVESTTAKIATTYTYKVGSNAHQTYPTHMYVWYLTIVDKDSDGDFDAYTAERIEELDDFFKYEGTSIRINFSSNGIRFFTSVNAQKCADLIDGTLLDGVLEGFKMTRTGTLYKKYTGSDSAITFDTGVSSDVYGGKAGNNFRVFSTVGDRNWFTGMLTGLDGDAATLDMDIQSRPYAILELNGETVTIYGGTVQRSIYYVATQNRDTWNPGTVYDNFVENLITTVENAKN